MVRRFVRRTGIDANTMSNQSVVCSVIRDMVRFIITTPIHVNSFTKWAVDFAFYN